MSTSQERNVSARWNRALAVLGMKRPNRSAIDPWANVWASTPPF